MNTTNDARALWLTLLSFVPRISFARAVAIAAAVGVLAATMTVAAPTFAEEAAPAAMSADEALKAAGLDSKEAIAGTPIGSDGGGYPVDMLWTVIAAILVFWMQAGFAMVESGLTRAKNAVNIFMKNLMDFAVGTIVFWMIGFGLMFGTTAGGWIGTDGFFLAPYGNDAWTYVFLFFQTVFCATAATIVSGAVAERTKFNGYLVYTVVLSGLIYPISGSWYWGGLFKGAGWMEAPDGGILAGMGLPGFIDFAGSTVVHSIGGWAALAGAIVLGPRLGKYDADGNPRPIRGHNMSLATLGVFILWMGWFGFNAGSTTGVTGGADITGGAGKAFAFIAVNTNLAAAAGAIGAMVTVWATTGKPDLGMSLNGALAGLVSITAPCANVMPWASVVIGLIGGAIVVLSVNFFDRTVKVDDPVGAISVHGVCGAWGTLAAGIFAIGGPSGAQMATQVIGILAAFIWSFGTCFIMFKIISATVGFRVSKEEEIEGLDLSEHGSEAYPNDFVGTGATAAKMEGDAELKAAEA